MSARQRKVHNINRRDFINMASAVGLAGGALCQFACGSDKPKKKINYRPNTPCLSCRYFEISLQTFCCWKKRYNPHNLRSLEDRSHRPKHLRDSLRPLWS